MVAAFLIAALIFGEPSHLTPNWGDIPTWLAVAVATAGGWIALSQLRSQQSQLRDQQKVLLQDMEDRRTAQASRVFIGVPSERERRDSVRPFVKNASDFPIFEAELWYINPDGLSLMDQDDDNYLGTMLPADERPGPCDFPSDEGLRRTVLTFRDANSVYWIRVPGGVLDEQSARPRLESVRVALGRFPSELGPVGRAARRGSGDAGGPASGPGDRVGRG